METLINLIEILDSLEHKARLAVRQARNAERDLANLKDGHRSAYFTHGHTQTSAKTAAARAWGEAWAYCQSHGLVTSALRLADGEVVDALVAADGLYGELSRAS